MFNHLKPRSIYFFVLLSTLFFAATATAQYTYSLSGKLSGGAGKRLYFSSDVYVPNSEKQRLDSVTIDQHDEFKLSGKISYAGTYSLFFSDQKAFLAVILDTQHPVSIAGQSAAIYKASVSGPEHVVMQKFYAQDKAIQDSLEVTHRAALATQRKQPVDSALLAGYISSLRGLNGKRSVLIKEFANNYPKSYISLLNMEGFIGNLISYDDAAGYLKSLPRIYHQNPLYLKVSGLIQGHQATQVGKTLTDFEVKDLDGKTINIKALREKSDYLIVDFWASWCGPCRANNPALKQLYQKFKAKNVEIVGISIDENIKNWKTAVKQEGTGWLQLSDANGFNSKTALAADVRSIPAYLLIDKSGKLLLKTHKVAELQSKLEQLFPAK